MDGTPPEALLAYLRQGPNQPPAVCFLKTRPPVTSYRTLRFVQPHDGDDWEVLRGLKMPKADKEVEAFFRSLLPDDVRINVKPMFGHAAAFVNGNMFAGTFGRQVFVRLSEDEGTILMKEKGASGFAPMEGRPMKGYVVIPDSWVATPGKARLWVSKSLVWTSAMPPKKKKTSTLP